MDSSIADNKLNMSLDDIIKKERKAKQRQQESGMQGAVRKRVAAKRINRGKRSIAMRSITRRNRQQTAGSRGLSKVAAMKVVNRLVKKAIRRRVNQSLINRAVTLRRRALRRNSAVRPAVRGLRARRQAAVVGSRLMGRLSGVSQRSRIIRRNAVRREPIMFTSPQMVRGRGLSHVGQLASDSEAFMVEQREIAHPMLQQKTLRRGVVAAQPHREVIMQRRSRPVIVEQQPIIIRRGGIRKRTMLEEPSVVVVRNPRQMQFRAHPEFGRVRRVVSTRPRNRVARRSQYVINPNAAQMRKALGIGLRRSEPQRFEASSTFLQRIPVTNRRGRGFQDVLYN